MAPRLNIHHSQVFSVAAWKLHTSCQRRKNFLQVQFWVGLSASAAPAVAVQLHVRRMEHRVNVTIIATRRAHVAFDAAKHCQLTIWCGCLSASERGTSIMTILLTTAAAAHMERS